MSNKRVFSVSVYKEGKEINSVLIPPSKRYLTIGKDPDNDLSIAIPGIPDRHTLIENRRYNYYLILPPALDGIIYRDNEKNYIHTTELIKRAGLKKKKDSYIITFAPGRPFFMKIGDILLSFSYTELPHKAIPEKTERSIKNSLISSEDYSFLLILLLSAAINFSIVGYLNTIEIKKLEHIEVMAQMPERFAKLIFKPAERKIEKKIAKSKAEEKKEEEKAEKKQEEKTKEATKGNITEANVAKEPSSKEGVDGVSSRVKSKGLLGLITAKEKPVFASQNIFDIEGEEVQHPKMAALPDARTSGGAFESVKRLDNIGLDSSEIKPAGKHKDIGDILKEKKVASLGSPNEMTDKKVIISERSEAEVYKTIYTYSGGVRYLYNNALRKDPTLKGKATVKLTISEEGKVIKVEMTSSTLNNPELEEAIMNRINKWQFSEIRGAGDFVISYTFDFSPTN